MKIKNSLVLIVFVLFLFGAQLKAQTVYVTETGKKYHAKNCDIVKTGKKGIELSEAKKKGLVRSLLGHLIDFIKGICAFSSL